jgi:hypothetical protein
LGNEIHLHFPGDHLLLRFGVEADVACYRTADKSGTHELADPPAGQRRIVGYDSQATLPLADEFIDQTLGRSDGHKSADHQGGAIWDEAHSVLKVCRFHKVPEPCFDLFARRRHATRPLTSETMKRLFWGIKLTFSAVKD